MSNEIVDNHIESRFEIWVEGELAGFANYQLHDHEIVFTHTEIFDKFEGQHLGSELARSALNRARSRALRVVPQCPFIRSFIADHPQYTDLVDTSGKL